MKAALDQLHPPTRVAEAVVPTHGTRPLKWQRMLAIFLSGRSLNMFEGEREGDHALHSTVAGLQSRGLTILRKDETVRGYMGAPTRVCRYWLAPESFPLARQLLGLPAADAVMLAACQ